MYKFAREKCVLFDKWCTSNKVADFQTLRKIVAFVKTVEVVDAVSCEKLDASYQPFLTEGLVSVDDKLTNQVKVAMLHYTGAQQSFITADTLPDPEKTFCVVMCQSEVLKWVQ